jgi:hypothetical protein
MPMSMTSHEKRSKESVLRRLNKTVEENCYLAQFYIIAQQVARLHPAARHELLALCDEAISTSAQRTRNAVRVAAAKVMVALLPDSFDRIQCWLQRNRPRSVLELHFSFFCFLHQVSDSKRPRSLKASVLELVRKYLRTARSHVAQAAWMAGDLLGDHWRLNESLPVLLELAEGAQHAVGRSAIIHGLTEAFARCQRESDRKQIRVTLERVLATDPHREVRLSARMALDRLRDGKESGKPQRVETSA